MCSGCIVHDMTCARWWHGSNEKKLYTCKRCKRNCQQDGDGRFEDDRQTPQRESGASWFSQRTQRRTALHFRIAYAYRFLLPVWFISRKRCLCPSSYIYIPIHIRSIRWNTPHSISKQSRADRSTQRARSIESRSIKHKTITNNQRNTNTVLYGVWSDGMVLKK